MAFDLAGKKGTGLVKTCWVAAFVLMTAVAGPAQAQEPGAESSIDLGLMITADRGYGKDYLVGEPVLFTLSLTNYSAHRVSVAPAPFLGAGLRLTYQTPNTPVYEIKAPTAGYRPAPKAIKLAPFETVEYPVLAVYDVEDKLIMSVTVNGKEENRSLHHLVFDHESAYRIWAELDVKINGAFDRTVTTRFPAEILVRVPRPDQIEGAILIREVSRKSIVQAVQDARALQGDVPFFEWAVSHYPESRFTPHFLYLLANTYNGFANAFLQGGYRAKAIQTYERLIRDYPSYPLVDEAMQLLALAYDQDEQQDKAAEIMRRLAEKNPKMAAQRSDQDFFKKYLDTGGLDFPPELWMLVP